ncbi:GNAT family N-acetyltransferase [Roseovarius salinarum]|uniref:GNAT family N-acetyltransferase n=1 Tax=Roseovarius salinarum TaxID=1981892 RepID=UPI000C33C4F1|nr:N-acetyltransferase [Roseovarius salinarum]
MRVSTDDQADAGAIVGLFEETFAASEGAEEGALIGQLAKALLETTSPDDLFVVSAWEKGSLVASLLFTRLDFAADERTVFLLGPVAVRPDRQGMGIGQALLRQGLEALRAGGVDVAVTYGDPAYYAKVGFHPVGEDDVPPPQPLKFPHGWQAQALDGKAMKPLAGPSRCVAAFADPRYW